MIFVFDLDGTICFKGRRVSENILSALEELSAKGHEVIFASARPIRDMLPVIHKRFHQNIMIGGNGSLVYKKGKIVRMTAFSAETVRDIKKLITAFHPGYLIDSEWDYAYTGPADHPILQNVDPAGLARLVNVSALKSIVKILLFTSGKTERLAEKLSDLNVTVTRHNQEELLDISPKGIDKWSALHSIGVQEGEYIAFGNDANDVTMFKHARHAVMIGYHEQLATFAKTAIDLKADGEQKIVEQLKWLINPSVSPQAGRWG